jgi:hypothetical protein
MHQNNLPQEGQRCFAGGLRAKKGRKLRKRMASPRLLGVFPAAPTCSSQDKGRMGCTGTRNGHRKWHLCNGCRVRHCSPWPREWPWAGWQRALGSNGQPLRTAQSQYEWCSACRCPGCSRCSRRTMLFQCRAASCVGRAHFCEFGAASPAAPHPTHCSCGRATVSTHPLTANDPLGRASLSVLCARLIFTLKGAFRNFFTTWDVS